MANSIVSQKFKINIGRQLVESISEPANTAYYMFLGNHVDRANTSNLAIETTENQLTYDVYRNMICGKRVASNDLAFMIKNKPYVTNQLWTMYDNQEKYPDKDYYTIVDEGAYFHVYKCLDNNNLSNSTVQPTFSDISGANTKVYQTSDGYRWKYMSSISSTDKLKFATSDYFPVFANTTVSDVAITGAVEIVKVDDGGMNYTNYYNGTFNANDIRVTGIPEFYSLSNATPTTNGFFTGCILYLSTGTGLGQYREIKDSFYNSNGSYITLLSAFDITPTNGTTYQINPAVKVRGDGMETSAAVGRALVNSFSTNSIYRVEMFDLGEGYQHANAYVVSNSVVGHTNATVRAILGPAGGHGYDLQQELEATRLCFSVRFSNTESNTILTESNFKQIGLIRDPLFANVYIQLSSLQGAFLVDEPVYKVKPVRNNTNATINTTSSTITCPTGDFVNQYIAGDQLYIQSGNNLLVQIANVSSVTNSSTLVITTNGSFSCTETTVSQANVSTIAVCSGLPNNTFVVVTDVLGTYGSADILVGARSGARAVVNTVYRNDVVKGFNTFIQLNKYVGSSVSGTFLGNELVFQNSLDSSNAAVHSTSNSGGFLTLYTTNQLGAFVPSSTNLRGNTSGAEMTMANSYAPEVKFASGEVLYIENIDEVSRANNQQSQTFRLIFEF